LEKKETQKKGERMNKEIVEFVASHAEDAIVFDDCDSALIGYGLRIGLEPVAIYSHQLLVENFIGQGMSEEEAVEYVDYNIVGSWVGERTPIILYQP